MLSAENGHLVQFWTLNDAHYSQPTSTAQLRRAGRPHGLRERVIAVFRTTWAAMSVVLLLLLAACSDDAAETTEETTEEADEAGEDTAADEAPADDDPAALVPEAIREAGVLNVGNSPVYPPMSYLPEGEDDESARIGFDVDLATAIAGELGLEVNWMTQPYEQYIPSLGTGRIDLIHSAMQDLEERRETVDFVDYYLTGPQLFTTAEREAEFPDAASLCGGTVAVDSGDAGYRAAIDEFSASTCADAGLDPIEQVLTDSTPDALLQLQQGRVDAGIRGAESIRYIAFEQEPGVYALVGDPIAEIPVGIGVDKDNTDLRDAVAAALGVLVEDGTYAEIGERWGLSDILVDGVMVNGEPVS